MSTRWYPIYRRNGPQLRVFLPNFWMKLIRPQHEQPPNVVQFACSMEMTKYDVKNYLEKIYNIPVMEVRTRIKLGSIKQSLTVPYVTKADDIKIAYITLNKDVRFEYPNVNPEDTERKDKDLQSLEQAQNSYKEYVNKNKERPGAPGWFSF